MRIAFDGLESPVDLAERGLTVLQVKNSSLFARICESLISMKGDRAVEPYSVWDDDGCEIAPSKSFMVIQDPFNLPWKHKDLMGGLFSRLEKELLVDEGLRQEIQRLGNALELSVHKLDFQLNANYEFGVEWNLSSYLKAFSYEIEVFDTASLFDKLISFIDFGADMSIDRVMIFINLKTFLTKNDLSKLQERLFFHNMKALMVESYGAPHFADCEKKYIVDRDFVEFVFKKPSECPSSSQGRIYSNGFGVVTF